MTHRLPNRFEAFGDSLPTKRFVTKVGAAEGPAISQVRSWTSAATITTRDFAEPLEGLDAVHAPHRRSGTTTAGRRGNAASTRAIRVSFDNAVARAVQDCSLSDQTGFVNNEDA
jgi:hypothetical protein